MDLQKEYTRLQTKLEMVLDMISLKKEIDEADMWRVYWIHANGNNPVQIKNAEEKLINLKTEMDQQIKKYNES